MNKFSKIVALLMAVCFVVCLASCGGDAKVKVGVQSGTTGYSFMAGDADWGFDGFSNVEVASYDNAGLALKDVEAGNVKYVVIDADVAKSLVASNEGFKVIDIALTTESYGIAVDKNQPELLEKINGVLADKADAITTIIDSYANVDDNNSKDWAGTPIPAGTYDANKDQLVVATNAAFAPFEFVVGDGFAGIDMEIAKLVADELGMELVIMNMDFEAITGALGKNGVDVGIAGMTINAARKKVVNFTDSYFTDAYQVIIAKADDTTFDSCKTTEEVLDVLKGLKG